MGGVLVIRGGIWAVLSEHQLVTLILSYRAAKTRSKAKLAPPASFTRPLARRPPFSMGMIAWASLVGQLLARREGDVPLAHGSAHGSAGGRRPVLAISLVDAAATSSSAPPSALGSSPTAVACITAHPTARHGRLPIWSGWHHLSASSGGRWCSLWKVYRGISCRSSAVHILKISDHELRSLRCFQGLLRTCRPSPPAAGSGRPAGHKSRC